MGQRWVWTAGITILGLLLAGCDDGVERAGASTLFQLRTGECFTSEAGTSGRAMHLEDVTAVDCSTAHDGEVFAVVNHPAAADSDYPGDEAVAEFAEPQCLTHLEAYTGVAYDNSDLDVATVRPTRRSWDDRDDRQIGCIAYQRGKQLTGSRRAGTAG